MGQEVDPVRNMALSPSAIWIIAQQHLFHDKRAIQVEVARGRDFLSDRFPLLTSCLMNRQLGRQDSSQQRPIGVRVAVDEVLANGKAATGMARPNVPGKAIDEAQVLLDDDLVERLRREDPVDPTLFKIERHPRWRNLSNDHVLGGIHPMLRQPMTQQVIVHREKIGHTESEPLHFCCVANAKVLLRERDRLAVDILDHAHADWSLDAVNSHCTGKRHRHQHVRGIDEAVNQQFLDAAPAGGQLQLHRKPLPGEETVAVCVQQRRRANDGFKGDPQFRLLRLRHPRTTMQLHIGDSRGC